MNRWHAINSIQYHLGTLKFAIIVVISRVVKTIENYFASSAFPVAGFLSSSSLSKPCISERQSGSAVSTNQITAEKTSCLTSKHVKLFSQVYHRMTKNQQDQNHLSIIFLSSKDPWSNVSVHLLASCLLKFIICNTQE